MGKARECPWPRISGGDACVRWAKPSFALAHRRASDQIGVPESLRSLATGTALSPCTSNSWESCWISLIAELDARHTDLDHLAGVKFVERTVVARESDRAGHEAATEVVGEQVLAEARPARGVEEVVSQAELAEQPVELRTGVQPADHATVRESGDRLVIEFDDVRPRRG